MRLRCLTTLCAACLSSGCAGLLDIPDDPELVLEQPWSCLRDAEERPLPASDPAMLQVQACDFVSRCTVAVTGLTARLCAKGDPQCTAPLGGEVSDVDGLLELEAPTAPDGFDGYVELRGVATSERSLLFFEPPVTADFERPLRLPLLASNDLPAIVTGAGAALDATTGNVIIMAADCDGAPAAGVTYAMDQHQDQVTRLYVDEGLASPTALATDTSGIGAFLGVPPGSVEVSAYNSELERIGVIDVQAAPLTTTYGVLVPSP